MTDRILSLRAEHAEHFGQVLTDRIGREIIHWQRKWQYRWAANMKAAAVKLFHDQKLWLYSAEKRNKKLLRSVDAT
ncbi:hypothetical protein KEM54_002630, partial [Ascosphaera aggregata]